MEKYLATCRIFMITNSTSKIIPAILSRCLNIRVPAPSEQEIQSVLNMVAKKEGLNLPSELAKTIAAKSNRNLRYLALPCNEGGNLNYFVLFFQTSHFKPRGMSCSTVSIFFQPKRG